MAQQSVGQKEKASFMQALRSAMLCCGQALKSQDLRAGWLYCISILLAVQEFLWNLCSIQLPLPHFPHALRNSRGKLDPWIQVPCQMGLWDAQGDAEQ